MSLACDVLNPSVEITSRDCDIHQAVFIHHNSDVVVDKLSACVNILYYLSVQHYKKTLWHDIADAGVFLFYIFIIGTIFFWNSKSVNRKFIRN